MTTLRQAAEAALKAIDAALPYAPHRGEFDEVADIADDLRAALAAEQPEPVAWVPKWCDVHQHYKPCEHNPAPPAREPAEGAPADLVKRLMAAQHDLGYARELIEQLAACHDEPDCPAVALAREWLATGASPERVVTSLHVQVIDGPQPPTLEWEDEKPAEPVRSVSTNIGREPVRLTEEDIRGCLPIGIAEHSALVGKTEICRFARAVEDAVLRAQTERKKVGET